MTATRLQGKRRFPWDHRCLLDPPWNQGAEQRLLGCCFLDPEVAKAVSNQLSIIDFYSGHHQDILRAIQSLVSKNAIINPITVAAELEALNLSEKTGIQVVFDVASELTAAAWNQYLEIVLASSAQRKLLRLSNEIRSEAMNPSGPIGGPCQAFKNTIEGIVAKTNGTRRRNTFPMLNGPALAKADFTVNYVVEGLIIEGQPGVLGGPEKACKTVSALELAVACATNTPFMGQFPTSRKYTTLVFSSESGMTALVSNLNSLLRRREIVDEVTSVRRPMNLDDVPNLFLCGMTPDLSQQDQLDSLRDTIEELNGEIVAIDPAYLSMGGDVEASNLLSMGALLRRIGELAQEMKVTLLFCHHTNKQLHIGQVCQLTHLTQSGWREWPRQWFLINRTKVFDSNARSRIHNLIINIGGSAGHSGLFDVTIDEGCVDDPERLTTFTVSLASCPSNKLISNASDLTLQSGQAKVMDLLGKYQDGLTKNQIREARIGITNSKAVNKIIDKLVKHGVVEQVEERRKGRSQMIFRITRSSPVKSEIDSVKPADRMPPGLPASRSSPL